MGAHGQFLAELLKEADIHINGDRAGDISIYNNQLPERIFREGSLGIGESYMDKWWDSTKLDITLTKAHRADLDKKILKHWRIWPVLFSTMIENIITNPQKKKAFEIGKKHYDVGNELYSRMLDKRMVYSCGYWKSARTLDKAQEAKLELCCKKLGLKKGDKVLDIGCGWGSFLFYAEKRYKIKGVGLTVSKEQKKHCDSIDRKNITVLLTDYRTMHEKFDHIISIGMFEHVGWKNYPSYMSVVDRCLKPGGKFLLHTIGQDKASISVNPWIHKYIFPHGHLPALRQIKNAAQGKLHIWDVHEIGKDYDPTLMSWFANFDKHWKEIRKKHPKYDEKFYRMWKFYLLSCAAGFRTEKLRVWQILLSKENKPARYKIVR